MGGRQVPAEDGSYGSLPTPQMPQPPATGGAHRRQRAAGRDAQEERPLVVGVAGGPLACKQESFDAELWG